MYFRPKWADNKPEKTESGISAEIWYRTCLDATNQVKGSLMSVGPTERQALYLKRGLSQAGGKLSLFDGFGQEFSHETVEACMRHGWAVPWFENPINPDWIVCRLTDEGRKALKGFSADFLDEDE